MIHRSCCCGSSTIRSLLLKNGDLRPSGFGSSSGGIGRSLQQLPSSGRTTTFPRSCCTAAAATSSSFRHHRPLPARLFFFRDFGSSAAAAAAAESEQGGESGNRTSTSSRRRQFKDIPVHPSILRYVESVGVGIPPRRSRHHRSKKRGGGGGNRQQQQRRSGSGRFLPPPPFGPGSRVKIVRSVEPPAAPQGDGEKRRMTQFPVNNSGGGTVIPEIALAGRSNVGKSTLLNALLYGNKRRPEAVADADAAAGGKDDGGDGKKGRGKKTMSNKARSRRRMLEMAKLPRGVKAGTSNRPGETRAVTFYQLSSSPQSSPPPPSRVAAAGNGKEVGRGGSGALPSPEIATTKKKLWLVDLPGYGFSYASEEAAAGFRSLIRDYLLLRGDSGRALKRLLLLVDARHGMKAADFDFLDELQSPPLGPMEEGEERPRQHRPSPDLGRVGRRQAMPPIQIVLTKCDLVTQNDLCRRVAQVREQLSDALRREPSQLPVMLVSAQHQDGLVELQRELSSLIPASTPGRRYGKRNNDSRPQRPQQVGMKRNKKM